MGKLLLQIIVGFSLWFALWTIGISWPWRVVTIVCGIFLTHECWVRFVAPASVVHPDAIQVAPDDPLMAAAREEAKRTLPFFLELFPDHRKTSGVKFRYVNDVGVDEFLWGELVSVDGDRARVHVKTHPVNPAATFDPDQQIALEDILDWQVEFPDGTLRGGFSNRAMMRIVEQREGFLPRDLRRQLRRFRDFPDGAPQSRYPILAASSADLRIEATNDWGGKRREYEFVIERATPERVRHLLHSMTWERLAQILATRADRVYLDVRNNEDGTFVLTFGDGTSEFWTSGNPLTKDQAEGCLLRFVNQDADCLKGFQWKFFQAQPRPGCLGLMLIAAVSAWSSG